jgi:hypothetical protein
MLSMAVFFSYWIVDVSKKPLAENRARRGERENYEMLFGYIEVLRIS